MTPTAASAHPAHQHPHIRNVQCNVQQTDPLGQIERHIHAIAPFADLIGWNECGTIPIRAAVRRLPGFATFHPPGSAGSVPISWRTVEFAMLDKRSVRVHPGVSGVTPARYINSVRLRHRSSGIVFTRINTHVVHHIEVGGHPRLTDAIHGQNERAKLHFRMLRDAIVEAKTHGAVIVGGDFNVDYLAEKRATVATPWFPLSILSTVATPVMPNHGTHGDRAIDWTLLAGKAHKVSIKVLPHGSSDHNPVQTIVELMK